MTRAVHMLHRKPEGHVARCGSRHGCIHPDKAIVTCKRCLKLIARQPSGAATDRASAVEPVERRGTVGASEFSIAHLSPVAACPACGTAVDADDQLVAQHKAYVARLESLLLEVVEATRRHIEASLDVASLLPEQDSNWPNGYDFAALEEAQDEQTEASDMLRSKLAEADALVPAIEAARGGIGGKS